MNDYEDDLRSAFRRQNPSPDFTGRTMRRIAILDREKPREKTGWISKLVEFFQPPRIKWTRLTTVSAIAFILVAVGFSVYYHSENEKRRLAEIAEGESAKEKVMLAMRIASAKLNVAQRKVRESGVREADSR